jgi:hypothetical protein
MICIQKKASDGELKSVMDWYGGHMMISSMLRIIESILSHTTHQMAHQLARPVARPAFCQADFLGI